jgi:hypothetical protein
MRAAIGCKVELLASISQLMLAAIYSGDRFPAWRGNGFLDALSGLDLRRLELQNSPVRRQEVSPTVPDGQTGLPYVLTDAGAVLWLELTP